MKKPPATSTIPTSTPSGPPTADTREGSRRDRCHDDRTRSSRRRRRAGPPSGRPSSPVQRAMAVPRLRLIVEPESDLHGDLVVGDPAVHDGVPNLDDLEPVEVSQRLGSPLDTVADGVVGVLIGGSDDL